MAGSTLKLEIITPERVALSAETTSVTLAAVDGYLGIWPNHAPLIAALRPGSLRYNSKNGEELLFVSGGFVEVSDNLVSIIAPAAEIKNEIDVQRAQQSKERAEERLRNKDGVDITRAQASLARAMARIDAHSGK